MTRSDARRIADLATDAAVHRAFGWFHLHEIRLRQWQMEFLAIPAPCFDEQARATWFCDRFGEIGLRQPHVDPEGNAVALYGEAAAGGPAVLLSAHLDTVFPPGTPCVPREGGDRIACPGACDNGAGLTALLALAVALQHGRICLPCPVIVAANVGEEGEGNLRGMRHLLAEPPFGLRPAVVLALEGAGNALVVDRALGSRRLRVTVHGPGGHSWADAHRSNPILVLSSALLAVARLPLPARPRTTLNVGVLQGGTSVNSVPETATALLDLRSTADDELDRLEGAVLATLSSSVAGETRSGPPGERLRLSVERIGVRPVGALAPESTLRRSLRAVDRHLGIATDARIGSTDANLPLAAGIPALAIGAGGQGGNLHATSEWYDPTGRDLALRRILLLLLDSCHEVCRSATDTPATGTPAEDAPVTDAPANPFAENADLRPQLRSTESAEAVP